MGHASDVPQLQKNTSAPRMDGFGDSAPCLYLRLGINPWRILIALSLPGDLGSLGNQQAGGSSLAVIGGSELARNKACSSAVSRQWRHYDSIGKRQRAEVVGLKQSLVVHIDSIIVNQTRDPRRVGGDSPAGIYDVDHAQSCQ